MVKMCQQPQDREREHMLRKTRRNYRTIKFSPVNPGGCCSKFHFANSLVTQWTHWQQHRVWKVKATVKLNKSKKGSTRMWTKFSLDFQGSKTMERKPHQRSPLRLSKIHYKHYKHYIHYIPYIHCIHCITLHTLHYITLY